MPSRRRKSLDEPPAAGVVRPLLRRWLLQLVALAAGIGLVLGGVIWLGNFARDQIRQHERFQFAFADIDCNPPPNLGRAEFLADVQDYSELPERLPILDEGLADRLAKAFARHPWVARVEKVEVAPPQSVHVTLLYRQPVLAVVVGPELVPSGGDGLMEPASKLPLRAVDEKGVLLPKKAPVAALPVLHGAPRPAGGAGQAWGDPGVLAAAQTAALLKSRLARLGITALSWSDQGLVLWGQDAKVLWGHPPNDNTHQEASTAVKEQRLLEAWSKVETLPSWWLCMREFDVRPREGMTECWIWRQTPPP